NMVVISRRAQGRLEENYLPESARLPRGWQLTERRYREGSIYLQTQKGERRASGSYYTPDHIVGHIVDKTLSAVCESASRQLDAEIAEIDQALANATRAAREE